MDPVGVESVPNEGSALSLPFRRIPVFDSANILARAREIFLLDSTAKRILPMEGIRGFAVILVFFVHYYWAMASQMAPGCGSMAWSKALELTGHAGVDLFFLLSGYLIYSAVQNPKFQFRRFAKRRIHRLYPAFLAVLVVYLVLSFFLPERSRLPQTWGMWFPYLIANMLFLPGIFEIEPLFLVAWSLSYEATYYLGLPATFWLFRLRMASRTKKVLVVLSLTLVYLILNLCWGSFTIDSLLLRPFHHPKMIMFTGGIILYELRDVTRFRQSLRPQAEWIAAVLFIGALLVPVLTENPWGMSPALTAELAPVKGAIRATALLLGCSAFGAFAMLANGWLAKAMSWEPLRALGNMSYSYYLIHALAVNGAGLATRKLLGGAALPQAAFWLCMTPVFVLTLLFSTALFICVERPLSLSHSA